MKRWNMLICVIALVILFPLASISAQAEPTAIVDRAFTEAGAQEGRILDRVNAQYTWDQLVFPDASYGCPQPGAAYTQAQVSGYIITISPLDSNVVYDFRASQDGAVFFLCSVNGQTVSGTPGAVTPAVPVVPTVAAPTAAPVPTVLTAPVLTYVSTSGNVVIGGADATAPAVIVTGDAARRYEGQVFYPSAARDFGRFRWSPDGTKLAFTDVRNQQLFLTTSGQATQLVASNLLVLVPPVWSADGTELAYTVYTGQAVPNSTEVVIQVQAVTGAGAAPRVVGTFNFGQGCGGGGFSPSLSAYFDDAGYGGNPLNLVWTAQGFIHSLNCTGVGIRLTAFDGTVIWEQPYLKNLTVAPNGTQAVALAGILGDQTGFAVNSAVRVDMASGETMPLVETPNLHALGWSADSSTVYVVTREVSRSVDGSPNAQLGTQLFTVWPATFEEYMLTLWSVPLTGGNPSLVTTFAGFSVGNIVGEPGSDRIVVSVTASELAAVEAINAGQSLDQVIPLRPVTNLWLVAPGAAPGTGVFEQLFTDARSPAYSPAAQFSAVPSTGSAPLGGNLLVGGKAVVNVAQGDALNLRESPSTSANVVSTLLRGEVVTIVTGPQVADGLRWWQVRVDATGALGWAVDQVTTNGIAEQTLLPQ